MLGHHESCHLWRPAQKFAKSSGVAYPGCCALIAHDMSSPSRRASLAPPTACMPCHIAPHWTAHRRADNEGIRARVKADLGADAGAVDFLPFTDLEQSVRDDIQMLKDSPLMDPAVAVHGYIYDVSFRPEDPSSHFYIVCIRLQQMCFDHADHGAI